MISFEREIKEFLTSKRIVFVDNGSDYKEPDFYIHGKNRIAHLEVKEKRQHYNPSQWPIIQEQFMFILDELTARKLMRYEETGCLFVRDNLTGFYYFANVLSLWLMPRYRCNREMDKGHLKGKWILDLRDFMSSDKLVDMFVFMRDYVDESPGLFGRAHVECYRPDFYNEDDIKVYGTKRTI